MDPLAQLQDIQLPDKIPNYPIAIGWWILAILSIAVIIFISLKIINYKKSRRPQKAALTQINTHQVISTSELVTILKWAALQYFPRENIANLYGKSFHLFLINSLPTKYQAKFEALAADTLVNMYQKEVPNETADNFAKASIYWLKHALPPKQNTLETPQVLEAKS